MKAEDEVRLIQDALIKFWQMYMTWFTWHFGLHMVALGGIFSVKYLVDRR